MVFARLTPADKDAFFALLDELSVSCLRAPRHAWSDGVAEVLIVYVLAPHRVPELWQVLRVSPGFVWEWGRRGDGEGGRCVRRAACAFLPDAASARHKWMEEARSSKSLPSSLFVSLSSPFELLYFPGAVASPRPSASPPPCPVARTVTDQYPRLRRRRLAVLLDGSRLPRRRCGRITGARTRCRAPRRMGSRARRRGGTRARRRSLLPPCSPSTTS